MMHLHDFEVVARPKNFGRFAREPEKGIDAGGIVGGPDHRNLRFQFRDLKRLGVIVTRRADDNGFFVLCAERSDGRRSPCAN